MTQEDFESAFSLTGEVALVTGGGTGLGLVITECLAAAGAQVVITGRRKSVLDEAVESIGSAVVAMPGDITQFDFLPELVAEIEREVGPLSILVNNAGVHMKKPALETSVEEFADVVDVHLFASFALAREAAKVMLPRRKGSIIFIGSMAALMGVPDIPAYSAGKSAVMGLTRALTAEWAAQGVRVNAIVPGWIDVGMARSVLEENPQRKNKILSRTPMGRMGSPDNVGWAAVYLCSPAARFVTGTSLVVDGGASVGF